MAYLFPLILSWFIVGIIIRSTIFKRSGETIGLSLSYYLGLSLIHLPGAAIYLIRDFSYSDPAIVFKGFCLATYGVWAFCFGIVSVRRYINRYKMPLYKANTRIQNKFQIPIDRLARLFVSIGLLTQLVVIPVFGSVPTLSSLLSGMASLSVVGVCLGIWQALITGKKKSFALWLFVAFLFPFITLLHSAFLGYGVHKLIVVLSFVYVFRRLRVKEIIFLFIITYLGISLFVTYFRDRSEIRHLIWRSGAGYEQRIGKVGNMIFNFDFFDPGNREHLIAIDKRLNQNYLVGRGQIYLENGHQEFANGKTLWFSFVGLVPRVLWPDKPSIGGGGDLVSRYTGMFFAGGTSVGAGQVFEFYINYGVPGVIIGFYLFGILLGYFDLRASGALLAGEYQRFLLWFLPGIGFLQAGGNFVEVTSTVVASIGSALVVNNLARRYDRRKKRRRGFQQNENIVPKKTSFH